MGQALESNAPYALVYFKRDGQDRTKIIDTLSMVDLEDY
jgi:serine protease Do